MYEQQGEMAADEDGGARLYQSLPLCVTTTNRVNDTPLLSTNDFGVFLWEGRATNDDGPTSVLCTCPPTPRCLACKRGGQTAIWVRRPFARRDQRNEKQFSFRERVIFGYYLILTVRPAREIIFFRLFTEYYVTPKCRCCRRIRGTTHPGYIDRSRSFFEFQVDFDGDLRRRYC